MASSSSSETLKANPSPSSPSNLSSVTLVGSPADPEKHQKQPDYFKPSEDSSTEYSDVDTPKKKPYKQAEHVKSPDRGKKESQEESYRRDSYKSEEYSRKDSFDTPEHKPRPLMKREPDLLPTSSPQHYPVNKYIFKIGNFEML